MTVTGRDILAHPTAEALAAALSSRPSAATPKHATGKNAAPDESLVRAIQHGDLPPLDSAALGYFPDHPPAGFPADLWTRERIVGDWCGGKAALLHIYETCFGRTGLITLPLFHTDLFGDSGQLMSAIGDGIALAKSCKARALVLTGMLPSVTGGGAAIARRFREPEWPVVTHGHATTAAALLMGAERLLESAGRDWSDATAGFLGLGSVGALACGLWLETRPFPHRLILADVPAKLADLETIAEKWKARTGGKTHVDIVLSPSSPPDMWYEADLMLCAVGADEVVDVTRLRPGTLLADDSAPPCFSWKLAGRRMRESGDILAIESGDIALPSPWQRISYRPKGLREIFPEESAPHPDDALRITSCVLSGLLLASGRASCRQTIGLTLPALAYEHFLDLERLELKAPRFRCGNERPDSAPSIGGFRRRGESC